MATVGGFISGSDYNTLVNGTTNVLGLGSGADGYGQIVPSKETYTSRGTANLIDNAEWNLLRTDINKCYQHQSNADIIGNEVTDGYIIGADASGPSVTRISGDTFSINTPNNGTGINDWVSGLTNIQNGKNNIHSSHYTVTGTRALVNSQRTLGWGTASNPSVYCDLAVTFQGGYGCTNSAGNRVTASGADHARHFFNAGGEIHLSQFLTGSTAKDTDWGTMLGNAGITKFKRNNTTGTGTALYRDGSTDLDGGGVDSALGFYQLTTGFSLIMRKNGSQAEYAENYIEIYAKRNVNYDEIQFRFFFNDVDSGDQTGTGPGVDEMVFAGGGSMGAGIDLLRPSGSYVSVIEPDSSVVTELGIT